MSVTQTETPAKTGQPVILITGHLTNFPVHVAAVGKKTIATKVSTTVYDRIGIYKLRTI